MTFRFNAAHNTMTSNTKFCKGTHNSKDDADLNAIPVSTGSGDEGKVEAYSGSKTVVFNTIFVPQQYACPCRRLTFLVQGCERIHHCTIEHARKAALAKLWLNRDQHMASSLVYADLYTQSSSFTGAGLKPQA